MARRKDSPQKAAMREMMRDYLKNNDISIKDGTDVNGIMRDMMSVLLEGALDEELDEELGYSKYDYRNKETDNSRNGHSSKTMHTSYGDMDVAIPRDRKGDYEPQLIKKYQNTVTLDMEEKRLSISSCIRCTSLCAFRRSSSSSWAFFALGSMSWKIVIPKLLYSSATSSLPDVFRIDGCHM